MAHISVLRSIKSWLTYSLCRNFTCSSIKRSTNLILKSWTPLSTVRVLNDTSYSVIANHKDLLKSKKIIQEVFRIQQRALVHRSRRPVPHSMANHIYTEVVEPDQDITQKNSTTGIGLSCIKELNKAVNPKDQMIHLTTTEILACLYAWPKHFTSNDPKGRSKIVVKDLYKGDMQTRKELDLNLHLQLELSKRIKTEDLETLFICAHAVFSSRGATLRYLTYLFDHIFLNFDQLSLSKSQLTKLLFYIYYFGDAPESLLSKLEEYFSKNVEIFDVDDFHIMAIGFFRANKRITDYCLLEAMAITVLLKLHSISGDALVSILKIFRHSGFVKVSFFTELAEKLAKLNLENVTSLNQIMHLAMAYGSLHLYNEEFLNCLVSKSETILSKMPQNKIRSKDLGRFVWALGTFNYKDEAFLMNTVVPVITNTMGKSKSLLYPESWIDIAMGLAYLGLFSDVLINAIFELEIAVKLRDHPLLEKSNQLLYLHHSVNIEHPSYKGNRLSQKFLDTLPEKAFGNMDRELSFRQGLASSFNTLRALLGEDKVHCGFILPHIHTADLEIHLDEKGCPVRFEENCLSPRRFCVDPPSDGVHTRIAIEVIGQNQCAVNTNMLLGNSQTKIRQLQKLGYQTHVIYPADATALDSMNESGREEYFKNLLESKFNLKLGL